MVMLQIGAGRILGVEFSVHLPMEMKSKMKGWTIFWRVPREIEGIAFA